MRGRNGRPRIAWAGGSGPCGAPPADPRSRALVLASAGLAPGGARADPPASDRQHAPAAFDEESPGTTTPSLREAARAFLEAHRLSPSVVAGCSPHQRPPGPRSARAITSLRRAPPRGAGRPRRRRGRGGAGRARRRGDEAHPPGDWVRGGALARSRSTERRSTRESPAPRAPGVSVVHVLPGTHRIEARLPGASAGAAARSGSCAAAVAPRNGSPSVRRERRPRLRPSGRACRRRCSSPAWASRRVLAGVTVWSGPDANSRNALPASPSQLQEDDVCPRAGLGAPTTSCSARARLWASAAALLGAWLDSTGTLLRAGDGERGAPAGERRGGRRRRALLMDASTRIGAFSDVLFELAHGGMGAVYLARARWRAGGHGRVRAARRHQAAAPPPLSGQSDAASSASSTRPRWPRASADHANVVSIHQVGNDEAGHFLVQDYVEGDTLQGLRRLRHDQASPPAAADRPAHRARRRCRDCTPCTRPPTPRGGRSASSTATCRRRTSSSGATA